SDEIIPADQPIEIEDEYNLALEEDVEDESLLEQPGDIQFTITSYRADYTVDTLVKRLKSESILRTPISTTPCMVPAARFTFRGVLTLDTARRGCCAVNRY